jgi:hypothetical protein
MKSIVKCLACLLLPLSFASIFLLGQADSTQSDLIAVENGWNRAELVHDAAALSRLMADDLVLTETDGSVKKWPSRPIPILISKSWNLTT